MAAPTTRAEAERDIEALYGLFAEWLELLIEHFGSAALTDEVIIWLAQQQYTHDARRR